MAPTDRKRAARRGNTLLEVAIGTALLAGTLVPGLRLMRDAMQVERDIETFALVANYAVSEMERQLALTADDWQTGFDGGSYAADGFPAVRYFASRTDSSGAGGMPDRLMVVSVVVWYDRDGDTVFDLGEPAQTMATKVAKLSAY